jgi:hypothetical protein
LSLHLVPSLIFILGLVSYSIVISLLIFTYRKTQFQSHSLLILSFSSFLFSETGRFIASFYDSDAENFVSDIWEVVNLFLVLGIIFVAYALLLFKHERLPSYSFVFSITGGALIASFFNPKWVTLEHEEKLGMWNASYDIVPSALVSLMLIFVIIEIVRPIIKKWRTTTNPQVKNHVRLLAIGFIIISVWAALTAFSGNETIRLIRPFLFPLGWLVWGYGLSKNPLVLCYTDIKPELLIIANKGGVPLFSFDFVIKEENINHTLISGFLTSFNLGLDTQLNVVDQYLIKKEKQHIIVQLGEKLNVYLVVTRSTKLIQSALRLFNNLFLEKYDEYISDQIYQMDNFSSAIELVEEILNPLFQDN